jgi:hypothetical protein
VAYRVYLDGIEIFQEGVMSANIEVVCGPQCNGTACFSATEGSLLFGAYRGTTNLPIGSQAVLLDGVLDEWRFWNGARTRLKIRVRGREGGRERRSQREGREGDKLVCCRSSTSTFF